MKLTHVMSADVITVSPDTPLKEVAEMLVEHHISGVPVVNRQRTVLGVVSEADILVKERGPQPRHEGLVAWILGGGVADPEKLSARTASEAMTSPAITIPLSRSVSEAARLMIENGVKRLPVVDVHGTLHGIVTRSDLVRAFARTDAEIEQEIREDVIKGALWIDERRVAVEVVGGEVTLSGDVECRSDAEMLPVLAERVPGVVSVHSTLEWELDDRKVRLQQVDPPVPLASKSR